MLRTSVSICLLSFRVQESFLHSLLSLTRTHLGLVAPLGPSCVHMACGSQVKPLRHLLFKLVDSQLPPALDQVNTLQNSSTSHNILYKSLVRVYFPHVIYIITTVDR